MGAVNIVSSLVLSKNCELKSSTLKTQEAHAEPGEDAEPLLEDEPDSSHRAADAGSKKSRFAQISKETRSIMLALWFLLMVDSLADGMVGMSLTTYYMDQKFPLSKSTLGDVVSASYFLSACSAIFAGPLSRHIGLVNTMVFTHIPSSAAVLLFPLPRSAAITFALLLLSLIHI